MSTHVSHSGGLITLQRKPLPVLLGAGVTHPSSRLKFQIGTTNKSTRFRLGSSWAIWAGSPISLRKSSDMLLTCPPLPIVLLGGFLVQKRSHRRQVPMGWCMGYCSGCLQHTLFCPLCLVGCFSMIPIQLPSGVKARFNWFIRMGIRMTRPTFEQFC
jgi:hypothetical protein